MAKNKKGHATGFNSDYTRAYKHETHQEDLINDYYRSVRKRAYYIVRTPFINHYLIKWQLYRGKDKYPKTCIASIAEISTKNKKLRQQFIKRLDKDSKTCLWSWHMVNAKEVKKIQKAYMKANFGVPHKAGELKQLVLKLNEENKDLLSS